MASTADLRVRVAELPGDAILMPGEVASWLGVRPRQLERLRVPCLDFGRKTKRYLKRDVAAWLEAKRNGHGHLDEKGAA